ncbi:FAD-linked oxidase C-terminal domain-containing protein [Candidatus Amarobacter glycogenicus]|uniref:FAD-binding oxidoreductase n=1 Tax=Candidatus Amarobacter glycogenicus TaxID=3140699 RepID=UPI00313610F6|nr:FAD-binding protein [Dehalococcoidia bacterium]MBK8561456.1 FAD-binding protein [Dehalococcoidia bacterium]MBK9343118.1 FAD-binding protein [Dehalococcoidia bacterium]MCC6268047.1 FAD-binding protein [Dehalococcoidia bacterium]
MPTRRDLVRALEEAAGAKNVLWRPEDLAVYEFDGTIERSTPHAVVLPGTTEEVAKVVRACNRFGVPITPRGAGTGLSGGSVPAKRGVVIGTGRMRQIIEIDKQNRLAVVEPGVPNLELSKAAAPFGLFYAPDPSSQQACTIGGNVAENAGGPHCLALGVTQNHVLGIEIVTADGDITWLGGRVSDSFGYDLRGIFIGSEGTLGVATKVVVRLVPLPASVITLLAVFDTVQQASETVSTIISAGMIPAAMEMMDRLTLQAAEAGLQCGYPPDAGAVLLVELDGLPEVIDSQAVRVRAECLERGAVEVRLASTQRERELLWRGRKGAIPSLGRLAPNYYILDGVVPRSKLVDVMEVVSAVSERYGIPIANVFHAGDGNLHPLVLFDERVPGAKERVLAAGGEIMKACVDAGGALSGEHGIGAEKRMFMPWLYNETDIENMERVRLVFGNAGQFNPCKLLPTGTGCGEMAHQAAAIRAAGPDAYV